MSKEILKTLYTSLYTIRRVEETLLDLFSKGLLRGTVHTCLGQEACAVGVIQALEIDKDIISSNHRGHGHFLAYCNEVEGLILEVMGKAEGICGGYGGSQHLQIRNFYSNGILGGMPPVATGMALAEKMKNSNAISVVFMGDGSVAEGNVYESFNIASLWDLPVLFVVEHNQYAQSTHYSLEHAGILSERAKPFGIKTTVVNGNDVEGVYSAAQLITSEIRNNKKPQLLFLDTYRLGPHSKGDDLRSKEEISERRAFDPLSIFKNRHHEEIWFAEVEDAIENRIAHFLNQLENR